MGLFVSKVWVKLDHGLSISALPTLAVVDMVVLNEEFVFNT